MGVVGSDYVTLLGPFYRYFNRKGWGYFLVVCFFIICFREMYTSEGINRKPLIKIYFIPEKWLTYPDLASRCVCHSHRHASYLVDKGVLRWHLSGVRASLVCLFVPWDDCRLNMQWQMAATSGTRGDSLLLCSSAWWEILLTPLNACIAWLADQTVFWTDYFQLNKVKRSQFNICLNILKFFSCNKLYLRNGRKVCRLDFGWKWFVFQWSKAYFFQLALTTHV